MKAISKENGVRIFNSPEFGEVRTVVNGKEVLFAATDVARALGYANPQKAIRDHCKSTGVNEMDTPTNGGVQKVKFITKGNVIRLVAGSTLPTAEKAESWIFDEVIPSVLETGAYMVTTEEDTPETIMAKAILYADKKIKEQANLLKEVSSKKYELEQKVIADKPKIDWAERNQQSRGLHTVSACLQDQRICADFMNKVLEQYKIQRKLSGEWALTAPWQNKGFAEAVPSIIEREGKEDKTTLQLKWFEKGRRLMLQLIKHADTDGYIYINKKTSRYSISKNGHGFTPFKFID